MPFTDEERETLVDGIISNCDCWEETDRELLSNFNDDKLKKLAQHVIEENKAKIAANAGDGTKKMSAPGDMTDEELEKEMEKRMSGRKDNSQSPTTVEQWLQNAPVEIQNTFRHAFQIEQQEKNKIIDQLTANLSGTEKHQQKDRLQHRSLEDLRSDLVLLPRPKPEQTANATKEDAVEAGWLKTIMSSAKHHTDDQDPLLLPTMNWNDENDSGQIGVQSAASIKHTNPDEEWLRKAPPSVRSLVENAAKLERRERDTIISQLTVNVSDTGTRLRMQDRLSEKSIDELRDLLELTRGVVQNRAPNYAGAAAPATNSLPDDERDDILMLPTMNLAEPERKKA